MASRPRPAAARTKVDLDDAAFGAELQRAARPRVRARRARRAPPGHAVDQDPRQGPRRRRQAVAPEGHRPRPRRARSARRIWAGGGIVFGPQPRHYTFKVNRKERRAALRSALSLHAERGLARGARRRAVRRRPSTKQAAALLDDWGQPAAVARRARRRGGQVALSFRNLERVVRAARRRASASPTSSAPRAARLAGRARRARPRAAPHARRRGGR